MSTSLWLSQVGLQGTRGSQPIKRMIAKMMTITSFDVRGVNRMGKLKRSESIKLLFIGNSYTQRNDLPGLLAHMAIQRGLKLKHELISAGGASLRTHWNAGRAQIAIDNGEPT